jgi:hypothetical protein
VAGAAEAALHLIENEERSDLVAERAQAAKEVRLRRPAAALALYRLHEDGGCFALLGHAAHRLQVAVRRKLNARHQRLERLAVPLLS